MAKRINTRRGPGRPPLNGVAGTRIQLHLPPFIIDQLRAFGNGSVSRGVVLLTQRLRQNAILGSRVNNDGQ